MSEFVWYTRLIVLVGAVVLLAQAVSGRGQSVLTFFAVVCLTLGFALFLGGLAWSGRTATVTATERRESKVEADQEPFVAPLPEKDTQRGHDATLADETTPEAEPQLHSSVPPLPEIRNSVRTFSVETADKIAGSGCPRCGKPLQAGQLAAVCPVCGSQHHAGCWADNRFHCATNLCRGRGSLEAPDGEDDLQVWGTA